MNMISHKKAKTKANDGTDWLLYSTSEDLCWKCSFTGVLSQQSVNLNFLMYLPNSVLCLLSF